MPYRQRCRDLPACERPNSLVSQICFCGRMEVNRSISHAPHAFDDIMLLRCLTEHVADRCGLDLTDGAAVRRVLDGDMSCCRGDVHDHSLCLELPAMLRLLFRLETSSSEDLGIAGLRRLWRQYSDILSRFRAAKLLQIASGADVQGESPIVS